MNKLATEQKKNLDTPRTEFRSLNDVAMRQVVNQMKIKMEKERLMLAIMPGSTPADAAFQGGAQKMESILGYITIGISTFKLVKKGIDFFRKVKK